MITTNGCYTIEIDRYHSDANLCDAPSISASGLKEVMGCPAKYWATSPYNPSRWPREETKALDLGRAAHALVLGEPEFAKYFIVSPYSEFRTNEARAWRDSQALTILKADDFEIVLAMMEAQRRSPAVAKAFTAGTPEVSLIWKDTETGIWLRSRPDWLPSDPASRLTADYKTCVSLEPRKLSADAHKYGYRVQAAMQMDGIQAVLGVKPRGIAHICQEKKPPYLAEVRMFTEEQIDDGRRFCRKALRLFADCMSSGKWPGYSDDGMYFETPHWAAYEMMETEDDAA